MTPLDKLYALCNPPTPFLDKLSKVAADIRAQRELDEFYDRERREQEQRDHDSERWEAEHCEPRGEE